MITGAPVLTEEFLAPKQSKLSTRPTPGLPCRASLSCLPASLPAYHPLANPPIIHLQSHPVQYILPPTRGEGPPTAAGQGLNLPKRKCLAR